MALTGPCKHTTFSPKMSKIKANIFISNEHSDVLMIERVKAVPLFVAMLTDPTRKTAFIPKEWITRNRTTLRKMREVLFTAAEQMLQEEKEKKANVASTSADAEAENVSDGKIEIG